MDPQAVAGPLLSEALRLTLLLSAPPLAAAFVVGALFSAFGSRLGTVEPAFAGVPRAIAAIGAAALAAPWTAAEIARFAHEVFARAFPGA